jgi:hypothetical protein
MHRADRELAQRNLDLVAELDRLNTGLFDGGSRSAKLAGRADEHTDLGREPPPEDASVTLDPDDESIMPARAPAGGIESRGLLMRRASCSRVALHKNGSSWYHGSSACGL